MASKGTELSGSSIYKMGPVMDEIEHTSRSPCTSSALWLILDPGGVAQTDADRVGFDPLELAAAAQSMRDARGPCILCGD
eukprot:scaffold15486_cov111-Isochrysis_galbana.AAC.12